MNTAIENRDYVIFLEGRWDAVSAKDEQARLKECVSKMPEDCESIVSSSLTSLTKLAFCSIILLFTDIAPLFLINIYNKPNYLSNKNPALPA